MHTISRRTLMQGSLASAAAIMTATVEFAQAQEAVRVGSKDFAESMILGEIYALLLEAAGLSVERKLNLGGTVIAHEALLANELDIYPEYTGTGLLVILGSTVEAATGGDGDGASPAAGATPTPDAAEAVYTYVRDEYKAQFDLVWLDRTPMSNSQALAVQRSFAEEHGLASISDLVALSSEVDIVISAPVDFEERDDGLVGLQTVYGDFEATVNGVAPGIKYQALMDGDANVVLAFSTDAEIAINDLVVLTDDKELWPPYNVAPVVTQAAIDANPVIPETLNALAPLITNEVMIQLNGQVIGADGEEPEDVAREFLIAQGLIAAG